MFLRWLAAAMCCAGRISSDMPLLCGCHRCRRGRCAATHVICRNAMVIEHAYAAEGDYPYTMGVLLLPDALSRRELLEDELLTSVDRALRPRG